MHNDSGNPPLLFAIRADGRIVRQFRLEVPNIDWEDIAIDDRGHLYLGDIGNNLGALPIRAIYRIDEPDPARPAERPLKPTAVSRYALPRGNRFDAESLDYDHGNAIVIAKYLDGREAEVFSVPFDPPAPLSRPAAAAIARRARRLHRARDRFRPRRRSHAPGGLLVDRHQDLSPRGRRRSTPGSS